MQAFGVSGAIALSILGFGFLWIGKPSGEAAVASLFMLLAYFVSHHQGARKTLATVLLPAAPIALLILQFRDPNDSHLASIAIVLAWIAGALIGAFAADPGKTSLRRFLACILVGALLHAAITLACLLNSLGASLDALETGASGPASPMAGWLMEPTLSVLSGVHAPPLAQWTGFAANSLIWGIPLGIALARVWRIRQPSAPSAAG
jgi:hypothetical protein